MQNTKKGFTLIELLLYISLTAVLLLTLSIFLSTMIGSKTKNQTIAEIESAGAQIVAKIAMTIRNAEHITAPTQSASSTSLTLDVVNSANDPTVFSASGGVLIMQEGSGLPIQMHSSRVTVVATSFINLSANNTPGSIKFSITLKHSGSGTTEFSYEKTFYGSASLR